MTKVKNVRWQNVRWWPQGERLDLLGCCGGVSISGSWLHKFPETDSRRSVISSRIFSWCGCVYILAALS